MSGQNRRDVGGIYPEGMDETAVNDLFWFEEDTIAEGGYDDFDALMKRDDEDEQEDEQTEEEDDE